MSAAEVLTMITLPLLAVVAQLQRIVPMLKANAEGMGRLLRHFGLDTTPAAPAAPASSPSSEPRAAAGNAR